MQLSRSMKMPRTQGIATLLLILSLTVHTVKSDSHVIVRPTDSDPSICGDGTTVCYTLSHLISGEPAFITDSSDLELEFMRGTHSITVSKKEWMLEGKKNVIWHGQNAEIVCEKSIMFSFIEIETLSIINLTFSKCGNKTSFTEINTLLFSNTVVKRAAVVNYSSVDYGRHGNINSRKNPFFWRLNNCSTVNDTMDTSIVEIIQAPAA